MVTSVGFPNLSSMKNSYVPLHQEWQVTASFSPFILKESADWPSPSDLFLPFLLWLLSLDPLVSWSIDGNSTCISLIWTPSSWRGRSTENCLSVIDGACLVFYATSSTSMQNTENEHSYVTQSHNYSFCHFSALLWKHLPPSLTSTLWLLYAAVGVWLYIWSFHQGHCGPLALIALFHWQHLQWLNDLTGQKSPSFLTWSSLPAQLTGLHRSGIQHPLHHQGEVPLWAIIIWNIRLPSQGPKPLLL